MEDVSDPLVGAVVGDRYRLTAEIGRGGMATVYRGEHLLLHKPVAVKVLLPDLSADENMAARFEHEAIAAARFDHPNVVSITDFGRTPDGRLFLVMEYLEGTPLCDLIHDELHLGWERAVELTRQLLRGLAHAHDAGVVHRDLKPSNVMVMAHPGGREVAKIIDFGIAKVFGGAASSKLPHVETEAGLVFGTADFLAPERLQGKGDSDPRADVYSAGVILYEALTGERPFRHEEVLETVRRALHETARPPSTIVPGIPQELDAVLARALAKRPEERYPSARAMLNALDPFVKRSATGTTGAASVSVPLAAASTSLPGLDVESVAPLALYRPPPRRNKLLWLIPVGAAAIVFVVALASRGSGGLSTLSAPLSPAAPAPGAPADPDADLDRTVRQAAEGKTIADRQRAFDRLVALGYGDRVPWVAMLGRDLQELGSCEARREVVARLRKTRDPAALPVLEQAAARPDNACLREDARAAIASLGGVAPAASDGRAEPPRKKRARSGGHF